MLYSSPAVSLVLCAVLVLCVRPAPVLGKGDMWPGASQSRGGLPCLTMPPDQTKNQVVLHVESPTKPYQEYRDPVLAVRNPVVVLDWSTNCYHPLNLSLNLPRGGFTNHYHRGLGRGIDVSVVGSVVGWASVARVIHSQNGGTHSECVGTMVVGVEKKKEKNLTMVA